MASWLPLVDVLLTVLHVAVVLAFVLLWIPRATARLHGWLVALTALSWLGFGAVYGIGYCFITDLQWHVKHALGVRRLPHSFIKYAADYVTGQNLSPQLVDSVTAAVFVLGCGAALWRYRQRQADARRVAA